MGVFASQSPGFYDDLLLVDLTPVECARRAFALAVSEMNATILRPRRKDEPGHGPHFAPIRQRIESLFCRCKGTLTLERHGTRTLADPESAFCSAS
jgi:hypothetical protein